MAFDVRKGVAFTATFVPDSVWSSPSAEVLSPGGSSKETPTATVDSLSTTIATVTDAKTFTLNYTSGLAVGTHYLVTSDGWSAVCELASIDYSLRADATDITADSTDVTADMTTGAGEASVTLTTALPDVPASNDTFRGVEISVPVAAGTTDEYSANWRVRVYEDQEELVQVFHAVRHVFNDPITEAEARKLVNEVWRSAELQPEEYRNVAELACTDVRRQLLASGRYPYLFGDSDAFKVAGLIALRLRLIDYNLIQPGWDPERYEDYYRRRLGVAIGEIIQSLTAYDSDDDDSYDDEPEYISNVRLLL